MKRTQLQRGTVPLSRRTPLRAKRLARPELRRRALVRAAVFARDGHQCRLAGHLPGRACLGELTVHHIWKDGQGGPYERTNLVTLCAGMNRWVEDSPDRAWALGLVKRRADTLAECWARMTEAGLVAYPA